MILLFIFFGAVLLLVLMAMNDNGQLHNPPAEELAKYEAIQAEEARQRMGMGEADDFYDPLHISDGVIDPSMLAGMHPSWKSEAYKMFPEAYEVFR